MSEIVSGRYFSYQEELFTGGTPYVAPRGKLFIDANDKLIVAPQRDRWYIPRGLIQYTVPIQKLMEGRALAKYYLSIIPMPLNGETGQLVFRLAELDAKRFITLEDPVVVGICTSNRLFYQARDFSLTQSVVKEYAKSGWNIHTRRKTFEQLQYWRNWFAQNNKLSIYTPSEMIEV